MKARIFVALKHTVLDPQAQAIHTALAGLGFRDVDSLRQGKFFDLTLARHLSAEQAREQLERIARDVLTNPVIEEFSWQILEE